EGVPDLEWYVQKHPNDAQGFYALGVVKALEEPQRALEHLNHALMLDPSHLLARYVRAVINLQEGNAGDSVADLKLVLNNEPKNVRALTQLSKAYLLQDQAEEACSLLKRAIDLSPQDATVLFLYSRALGRVGRKEEAQAVQAQFTQLEPSQNAR